MGIDKLKECSNIEDCCGAADIGAIIDNSDCVAYIERTFSSKQEAEATMKKYIDKANSVATEPCKIKHVIEQENDQYKLTASFEFAYQAETMIFQLGTR